jgi:hypothetical protein
LGGVRGLPPPHTPKSGTLPRKIPKTLNYWVKTGINFIEPGIFYRFNGINRQCKCYNKLVRKNCRNSAEFITMTAYLTRRNLP